MNSTSMHPLAQDYLARLKAAAGHLPAHERLELIAEIRSHLATGVQPGASEAEARNLIADLGPPEDIVAASGAPAPTPGAYPEQPSRWSRWGPIEVVAVVLLVAAPALPGVGPLAGIVTAWFSSRWTILDKLVATLLSLAPFLLLLAVFYYPWMVS